MFLRCIEFANFTFYKELFDINFIKILVILFSRKCLRNYLLSNDLNLVKKFWSLQIYQKMRILNQNLLKNIDREKIVFLSKKQLRQD